MAKYRKLSHTVYHCNFHVVFVPKYRYRILEGKVKDIVGHKIRQVCEWNDVEIEEMNIQADHVHMLISIPPKYAVSQYMGFLKGKLALQLFDRYPQLRKRYWGQHVWSRGYCVSTVGLDEERIKKYVKWQRRRDEETDATQGKLFD